MVPLESDGNQHYRHAGERGHPERPAAGATPVRRRVNATATALFDLLQDQENTGRGPPLAATQTKKAQKTVDATESSSVSGSLPSANANANSFNQANKGTRARADAGRKGKRGGQPTLFDFLTGEPSGVETVTQLAASSPPECAEAAPAELPPLLASEHERAHDASVTIASSERAKARDILAAMRALKTIEREGRPATALERQTLARFPGFGPVALSIFPDPVTGAYKDAAWQAAGEEMQSLLTPDEYESAKRTTFNAFYTSPTVISAMHAAIRRLGVPADATVLEPGCGTGNFLRLAPREMRFIGVELDHVSGRIARALHPGHDIRIENFRDTQIAEGTLDAVIGNVPFADVKLPYHGQKLSLHDFFLAKSVDALQQDGVLALVTTHFTLDKQNATIREYLATKADFVAALRLPADAFKREGTAVVTDILFLRRRAEDIPANHADPEWLQVAPLAIEGLEVAINRYFLRHPGMVLGAWSRKDTLYGEGYSVTSTGNLAEQLAAAIGRLPECAPLVVAKNRWEAAPASRPPAPTPHVTEGSFFLDDDRTVCQVSDGQAVPVVYGRTTLRAGGTMTGKRMAALIRLRDFARRVLQSQNEGWPESDRSDARRELNWAYDRFVASYGPINKTTLSETAAGQVMRRMPNLVKFREDPDAMLVMALEDYDETTGAARKAPILTKDVVGKHPPITIVQSAEEGLLVSLDRRGGVDVPFIAGLYGKPEDQVLGELGDLVFHDPGEQRWQTADEYLSGNVRAKLGAVLGASPPYNRNAEALARVQPEDVLPGEIDANIGAPWIPESDIQAFTAALFRVDSASVAIGHLAQDAIWSIEADAVAERSVAATSEYGTERANGTWLLQLALNMKTATVYDTIRVGDREERVVNHEETLAAREKQRLIKERFRAWLFADPERTERLVRLYNDTYNNLRLRSFDGSHLGFPGMSETVRLRMHQRDAIWRCMTAGNTLLAHVVGAGKTFTMAAAGMKMRQAGLIRKPMYVVPNHLLEQFGREFLHLYPNARLLMAGKEDLTPDRRKHLTAKIASGEWDGVIVTHSSFERIGMSRGYQERFLRQQIADYERLLCDRGNRPSGALRNLLKTIEKQKAAREERLKDLLAGDKKDDGLVFDELGVDHLFVDEAQYYKNLETPTKMDRVAGIQTGGSERAFDVYMKARYLDALHPGHGITFATGTPVSNTMVELFTLQRYLDPAGLASRGIAHFDAWAATFGEVIEAMEIAPDGASLRPRSRFARFTNLPELQQMFRSFADVQTAAMLHLPRPELSTGKPTVIACPMSEEQSRLQQELVKRYERLRSQKVDPREDNALAITTDGRKLAIDGRMLSPTAPDFSGSKVNALVDKVTAIWRETAQSRATQMIFCDLGVHPTPWGYSVYADICAKLTARGIQRGEIGMIGEAESDAKKQALFAQVRSGRVRVLLGSTQKMGTGTNVQQRLVALHHLDAPWKPAEVEQREGRILRQGNEHREVSIFRYVTEGSFDAYMWQALETKARFINQVVTGQNAARRAEDIAGSELSYAEVKAIASGNPAILTLAEADAELQRLHLLKKHHLDEQYIARRAVRELPKTIASLSERLSTLTQDEAIIVSQPTDPITIGSGAWPGPDAVGALGAILDAMPWHPRETHRVPLGVYRGLRFGIVLHPQSPPDVYLEGAMVREAGCLREHQGPRAVLNAIERLAQSYSSECARIRQELGILETQLRDYQARLGTPFHHDAYLSILGTVRDQLKACLAGTPREHGAEQQPSAAELAAQIKALKGAHTIDALERSGGPTIAAEEPVTARIRRRLQATLDSEAS